jgi:hypothetical protein
MVQANLPLDRIRHVLRHQSLQSAMIYVRVGDDRLRLLATLWPGVVQR